MKRRTLAATLAAATLAIGGCASTPGPTPRAMQDIDMEYVASVNNHARYQGTRVLWVNPPRKHAAHSSED